MKPAHFKTLCQAPCFILDRYLWLQLYNLHQPINNTQTVLCPVAAHVSHRTRRPRIMTRFYRTLSSRKRAPFAGPKLTAANFKCDVNAYSRSTLFPIKQIPSTWNDSVLSCLASLHSYALEEFRVTCRVWFVIKKSTMLQKMTIWQRVWTLIDVSKLCARHTIIVLVL